MAETDHSPVVANEVPWSQSLTEYDRQHLVTYLRLLDAESDGASPAEMARVILGLDVDKAPEQALRITERHLERARWMTQEGFVEFLK